MLSYSIFHIVGVLFLKLMYISFLFNGLVEIFFFYFVDVVCICL